MSCSPWGWGRLRTQAPGPPRPPTSRPRLPPPSAPHSLPSMTGTLLVHNTEGHTPAPGPLHLLRPKHSSIRCSQGSPPHLPTARAPLVAHPEGSPAFPDAPPTPAPSPLPLTPPSTFYSLHCTLHTLTGVNVCPCVNVMGMCFLVPVFAASPCSTRMPGDRDLQLFGFLPCFFSSPALCYNQRESPE